MMAKRGLDEELFVNGGEKDFAKRSPYCNRATIGACIVGSDSYCNANYKDWGFYCKAGAAAACMSLMCYDEPPVSVAIQFVYASATTVIDFCRTGTTSPSQYWGYNTMYETAYNAAYNYFIAHPPAGVPQTAIANNSKSYDNKKQVTKRQYDCCLAYDPITDSQCCKPKMTKICSI
jgi:hypothetical protein